MGTIPFNKTTITEWLPELQGMEERILAMIDITTDADDTFITGFISGVMSQIGGSLRAVRETLEVVIGQDTETDNTGVPE